MADTQQNTPVCSLCAHTPICKNQPQQSCPYLQLKDDRKREGVKPSGAPARPRKIFWQNIWTWCVRVMIAACMVLAFLAGRFSAHPRIVSKLPTMSRPIEPGAPPEDIIRQFFQAVRLHDVQKVMALCHPEFIQERNWQIADMLDSGPEALASVGEIMILNIMIDETALVTLSIHAGNETETGEMLLKKYQNEWRVVDVD